MEFRTAEFIIIGILGFSFWVVGSVNVFKKAELYYPGHKKTLLPWGKILYFIIGLTAWVFISFSLMGPREPLGTIKGKTEVNDIFMVLDISRSMMARDFQPNRLEVAKEKIIEFVGLRPTDRIGVIIFGNKVFTLLPLTQDIELVRKVVSGINEKKMGFLGGGTNMGDAIGLSVARAAKSFTKNKVIVLLTDGVANVGNLNPIQAAEEAAEKKLKIYTIGIGRKENNKVLKLTPGGRYQKIPGGSVDLETLEKISQITGAKSFFADDASALKRVFDEIQQLEKTEIDTSLRVVYRENYLPYLSMGVFFLILSEIFRRFILRESW